MGYVTGEEIKQALLRQKAHGGRLGSHLLYFKFITEDELVQALSAQHDIPGFRLDEHDISRKAVKKLPAEIAEDFQVLPIDFDKVTRTAKLAVVDPNDAEMVRKVKLTFRADAVKLFVAPESLLRMLITQYYGKKRNPGVSRIIELPELFDSKAGQREQVREEQLRRPNVLMFTKTTSLRSFLAPVFEREGIDLDIASTEEELKEYVIENTYNQVLVSQDSLDLFARVKDGHGLPLAKAEIVSFANVSGAFLENPVPYHRITRSLLRSLQIIADSRCRDHAWTPPYVLICNDIQRLGRSFDFPRLAIDGMQIAAYLLVPERPVKRNPKDAVTPENLSFLDFDRSLDIAKTLHFPWNVQGVLQAFLELISEMSPFDEEKTLDEEVKTAAQILSVVWYHRVALRAVDGSSSDVATTLRSKLRDLAGRFADLSVIEAYIHLLEQNNDEQSAGYDQIFVVSETDDMAHEFVARLDRSGFHTVHLRSMEEAKQLCDRHPPAAIIIDRECFPQHIMQASGMFKLDGIVLLYAYTRDRDPSLTLDMLDAGFDDVFAPPYDFDVITARISKSLRGLFRKGGSHQSGGFTASFKAFSFIDLMQILGQSIKTVRIDLWNSSGGKAAIYLERGRMAYAECAEMRGESAIYEVIGWGEDGGFSVEPTEVIPPANITDSNEGILMEGCRLLDESRI